MKSKRKIPAWLEKWQSEFRPCVDVCKDLETEALSKQLTPEQQEKVKAMIARAIEMDRSIDHDAKGAFEKISKELFPLWDEIKNYWREHGYSNIIIEQNGKKGVVNLDGAVALPAEYDDVCITYDDYFNTILWFVVKKDGKWGIVNDEQDTIIPFEYNEIFRKPDDYDYYILVKDGKQGLADPGGNTSIPIPVEMDAIYFVPHRDLTLSSKDGQWGWWWDEPNKSGIFKNYCEHIYDEIFVQRWEDRSMNDEDDDYIIARKGDDLHWILYWSVK